ncbi:MAG TPA: hypothetical protein VG984_02730 [Candidatus Paceibacterota bacterium]|nr:hypothetical protein [Candidatus Paceibacterota bacterium]
MDETNFMHQFMIKSARMEAIVSMAATAVEAKKGGFDTETNSFEQAFEADPKAKELYSRATALPMEEKIDLLVNLPAHVPNSAIEQLHIWSKNRDEIFADFTKSLAGQELDKKCEGPYNQLSQIMEQEWFRVLEDIVKD